MITILVKTDKIKASIERSSDSPGTNYIYFYSDKSFLKLAIQFCLILVQCKKMFFSNARSENINPI